MPSPIIHVATGYAIYRAARAYGPVRDHKSTPSPWRLLLATVALSQLPDFDWVPGVILGDIGAFHNNLTHSLVFGVLVALTVGGLGWLRDRSGFWLWFGLALVGHGLHVLFDLLTIGRGLMILWPFSSVRYEIPFKLFYGLHWSEGLISTRHLWTVATELAFLLLAVVLVYGVKWRLRSSPSAPRVEATSHSPVPPK